MMEDFYMPTDIQFKDDLRKEEIKLEELLNLLKNQEYEIPKDVFINIIHCLFIYSTGSAVPDKSGSTGSRRRFSFFFPFQ